MNAVLIKNNLKTNMTIFLAGLALIAMFIGKTSLAVVFSLLGVWIALHNESKYRSMMDEKVIETAIHDARYKAVTSLDNLKEPIEKPNYTLKELAKMAKEEEHNVKKESWRKEYNRAYKAGEIGKDGLPIIKENILLHIFAWLLAMFGMMVSWKIVVIAIALGVLAGRNQLVNDHYDKKEKENGTSDMEARSVTDATKTKDALAAKRTESYLVKEAIIKKNALKKISLLKARLEKIKAIKNI